MSNLAKDIATSPDHSVTRHQLLALLDRCAHYQLTCLLAPAGFGKSTLLRQWRDSHRDSDLAFVCLRNQHRDPVLFFQLLDDAIRDCYPGYAGMAFNRLSAETLLSAEDLAAHWMDALAEINTPLYIVIDDFQLADHALIQQTLAITIGQLPTHIHVVLASRSHPEFSLSQLKLTDQLLMLDRHDLRFTADELAALCRRSCPQMDAARRSELMSATEGWVAAIKLVLLAEHDGRPAPPGPLQAELPELVDYFARVVLNQVPAYVLRMLESSAILDGFCTDLCDAITGHEDSAAAIAYLQSRELFVSPMDDRPGWFRFHNLLQDYLFNRVMEQAPERVPELHRKAAQWFFRKADYDAALRHSRAVGDDFFMDMLGACALRWLKDGNFPALLDWVLPLPEQEIRHNTDLVGPLISALILSRRFNQARFYLDEFRQCSPGQLTGRFSDPNAAVFLEVMLQMFQDENGFRLSADREALLASAEHHDIRAFALAIVAYHYMQHAELDLALRYAQQAKDVLGQMGYDYLESYADLIIILCDRHSGRMFDAARHIEARYQHYNAEPHSHAWVNIATSLAVLRYEQNQQQTARDLIEQLLPRVNSCCATEVVASAYLVAARLFANAGQTGRSQKALDQLGRVLTLGNYDRFESQVVFEKVLQACSRNDTALLNQLVDSHGLRQRHERGAWNESRPYDEGWERSGLAVALWLRSEHRISEAIKVLRTLSQVLYQQNMAGRAVVAQAGLAVCEWQLGRRHAALGRLQRLVEQHGWVCVNRSVYDDTPGLAQMMAQAIASGALQMPDLYRMVFNDLLKDVAIDRAVKRSPSLELLTERELEILALLSEGLSNKEISDATTVALSTVKWHLKNIFAKLGVSSRAEAIVAAGQLP